MRTGHQGEFQLVPSATLSHNAANGLPAAAGADGDVRDPGLSQDAVARLAATALSGMNACAADLRTARDALACGDPTDPPAAWSPAASRTTVGLVLHGTFIDYCVPGGPAYLSGVLDPRDEIVRIDGQVPPPAAPPPRHRAAAPRRCPVAPPRRRRAAQPRRAAPPPPHGALTLRGQAPTEATIAPLLRGEDLPDTRVTVTVAKQGGFNHQARPRRPAAAIVRGTLTAAARVCAGGDAGAGAQGPARGRLPRL